MSNSQNEILSAALQRAVTESSSPGGVVYVGRGAETLFHGAVGQRCVKPERLSAEKDTIYDLASLTKVVATGVAAMLLVEAGELDLDKPLSAVLPMPEFRRFTIRHLITHTSGFPAGHPFVQDCTTIDEVVRHCVSIEPTWKPGTGRRYSDIDFLLLGRVVEVVAGDRLDAFCRKRIFEPLGMTRTAFTPPKSWAADCAATERDPKTKEMLRGVVHDENARAIGGVAGHAGLFSTAGDLAKFCRALLSGKLLKKETVAEMTRVGQVPLYPWQGLAWLVDPWYGGTMGHLPSRAAFGHTGWTGTSIWIDGDTGLFVIQLGNTCHPSSAQRDNGAFRKTFHDAVAKAFYPGKMNVHTGLDRLVHDGFEPLAGKRVALLTNLAAVDQLGRSVLDVLALEPRVNLKLIYGPEHGLRANAEAGENIKSEKGAVPVVSLYGDRKRPSEAELKSVDVLAIDLPDVGARFYTYMATMRDSLIACAEAGTPVVVLDRPNPLGGEIMEGPIATRTDLLTSSAAVPARHGMTLGELARFFEATTLKGMKLKLSVLPCDGWRRELLFADCALPWVPPSPNIPTPEIALFYAGMCLFEGTNVNEGRGTETPFQVCGAPWLDAEKVIAMVDPMDRRGCTLEATQYTPVSIPGKSATPRYMNEKCQGIRVNLTEPATFRPFTLAVALATAMYRHHPREFEWNSGFDTLAGARELRSRLEAGEAPSTVIAGYTQALRAFDLTRPKIYPA